MDFHKILEYLIKKFTVKTFLVYTFIKYLEYLIKKFIKSYNFLLFNLLEQTDRVV